MSNIRDTDLVLVSRGGTLYDCPASDLSSRLQDNDYLLVSRGGTPYKVSGSNINNIRDTDSLLINRGSTAYKVSGSVFKALLGSPWFTIFDRGSSSFGNTIWFADSETNSQGEMYVIGHRSGPDAANQYDYYAVECVILKFTSQGEVEWVRRIDLPSLPDEARACTVDGNGDCVFTYRTYFNNTYDIVIGRISRSGVLQNLSRLTSNYTSTYISYDNPLEIEALSNGDFLLSADYRPTSNVSFFIRLRSDLTRYYGDKAFAVRSGAGGQSFSSAINHSTGDLYVGGIIGGTYIGDSSKPRDLQNYYEMGAYLGRWDLDGNTYWAKKYVNGVHNGACRVNVTLVSNGEPVFIMTEANNGRSFSTGTDGSGTSTVWVNVVKCNTSGTVLWNRRIGNYYGHHTELHQADVDADGNIYVGINKHIGGGNPQENTVIKFSPSGSVLWQRRFTSNNTNDRLRSISVDDKGLLTFVFDGGVSKLPSDGNFLGSYNISASATLNVSDVTVDISNTVNGQFINLTPSVVDYTNTTTAQDTSNFLANVNVLPETLDYTVFEV